MAPGDTIIIEGAPGAGRSSVLSELVLRTNHGETSRAVKILNVHLQQVLPELLQALAFAGSATRENWLQTVSRRGESWIERIGEVGALGFGVSLQDSPDTVPPQDLFALERQVQAEKWHMPVIVAVDEAQRLPSGKDSPHALFLQTVHDAGTSLPFALVCAGLGGTQSRLRDLGLIHGVQTHSLGCLTIDEYTELLTRFCVHFGINMGACIERALSLVYATDGWPRHVHWAQQALAEVVLELGVDGNLDRIADWGKVQARSDELRQGYYATQFSGEMEFSRLLAGRVMFEFGKAGIEGQPITIGQVADLVDEYAESGASSEWRIPKGHNSESYVTHLIHCGALQVDSDNYSVTRPIPSFQRYIIERGGLDPDRLPRVGVSASHYLVPARNPEFRHKHLTLP